MQRDDDKLVQHAADLLARALESESSRPVIASVPAEALAAELQLDMTPGGRPLEAVVKMLADVAAATPRTSGPRFFNQLFGTRDPAAVLAEMLTALLNVSMYTYKVAGPHVLIERAILEHMGRWAGLPEGEGSLSSGGSLSALVAMLIARNEALPRWRDEGAGNERVCLYASEEAHYSIVKNAGILGIGRHRVRMIPVDEEGSMRPGALRGRIGVDLAEGFRPLMIVATAGTTTLGAFDPLEDIADVASENGIWLHVDGAYGASVALSARHRGLVAGVERADSVVWNPHKMMGVPLPCSALLLAKRGLLHEHLNEAADYLYQTERDELNPGTRSIHCGRRNDALKLWASWQYHGDEGFARRIDGLFALAAHAVERIEADPELRLVVRPQSTNVCFEVVGKPSDTICSELDRQGRLKIGFGVVGGRKAIRLACVNPDMDHGDLDTMFDEVKSVAASL